MRASSIVGLAARAPVRGAVPVALAARTDPGAARRAWAAGPAVDAPRAPAARERRRHHVPRVRHDRLGLDASKVADPPQWADARSEEGLGADRVSDPRDDPLVEERVADLPRRLERPQARGARARLEVVRQRIRAEAEQHRVAAQPRCRLDPQQLAAELGGNHLARPKAKPRPPAQLTGGSDAPPA